MYREREIYTCIYGGRRLFRTGVWPEKYLHIETVVSLIIISFLCGDTNPNCSISNYSLFLIHRLHRIGMLQYPCVSPLISDTHILTISQSHTFLFSYLVF